MITLNVLGQKTDQGTIAENENVIVGAERTKKYLPRLRGKSVGVVANQTSLIDGVHLVDTLMARGIDIVKVFSPEHGFRGKADAGQHIEDGTDVKTGLPIISLYGKNKKPFPEQLSGVDIVLFDIQDVGVRFYTYISTLHYVMEACAENDVPLIVLDRPNPNAHYVDGPVLDTNFRSFVGMHPVPVVYGMTIGEYARMINGEGWLANGVEAELSIVPCLNYNHQTPYSLPVPPSPNLRTDRSVQLYPGLCLFEGTSVSVGRGTDKPFEQFGHPDFPDTLESFKPESSPGATDPKHKAIVCYGFRLDASDSLNVNEFQLKYLLQAGELLKSKEFINNRRFFNLLAGNDILAEQILRGDDESTIRSSWESDLANFRKVRKKYLLYEK